MKEEKSDVRPESLSGEESPGDRFEISRRGFLKGLGGTAVAAAVFPKAAVSQEGTLRGVSVGSVTLRVNGQTHVIPRVEARTTLLDVLRNRLDLTGAKPICERASCGGCTVLLDGKAVYSCSILAMDAEGREITTVEGLASNGRLHPVQEAFVEHDALQCGFCTPGFVVAAVAFLQENPNPTLEEVKQGVSGNLCRCGTYTRIFEAVLAAAEKMRKGA
ncbi:MAG: hypothetical protein KatS3mg115_0764 [Candidatus Poribacteria bacterium]|nr:MAG: hypothetical protein KatS3mg115_0764 [Candidatus Poribacteria bacterium]